MKRGEKGQVLFLTQFYPPEMGAPQTRLHDLARHLQQSGWSVQVLTAMPNYPTGKIFSGYRWRLSSRETIDGISVLRTAILPSNSSWLPHRLASYLSFVGSSLVVGGLLAHSPQILIVESPPLFLGLSALVLKGIWKCKLVVNVSDLWPSSLVCMGLLSEGLPLRVAMRLEERLYRSADCVTCQSRGIRKGILERTPEALTAVAPNGCDPRLFSPAQRGNLREQFHLSSRRLVGYAGLLGLAQGTGIILEIAERLVDRSDIGFLIAGDGPERRSLERRVAEKSLPNVHFIGVLPRERMPQFVAGLDLAIIPLRYEIPGAIPSKIYETMASGVPILLMAKGEPQQIVEKAGAGVVLPYDVPGKAAVRIARLLDDPETLRQMAERGRAFVETFYSRTRIADFFGANLEALLQGRELPRDPMFD